MDKKSYFVPDYPAGFYKATTGTYSTFATIDDLHAAFQNLVLANSTYITSSLLGNDQSNTYPIYQYRLKPSGVSATNLNRHLPKLLICCGLHGEEKNSVFSTYHLVKDICENWRTSPLLTYLRWNVEIILIPSANPWGFMNNTRHNVNGVDLNRNFSYGWVSGTSTYPAQAFMLFAVRLLSVRNLLKHSNVPDGTPRLAPYIFADPAVLLYDM